jgi:hypothetical protein
MKSINVFWSSRALSNLILVTVVLLLLACNSEPSEDAIQTAIAATQEALPTATPTATNTPTPVPTATATPIPLALVALESLLIEPGDLPADWGGQQITSDWPATMRAMRKSETVPAQVIQQGFKAGTWGGGRCNYCSL